MRLDKQRPYGVVHGLSGVAFSQDGHSFDGNGNMVTDPEAVQEENAALPAAIPAPVGFVAQTSEPPPLSPLVSKVNPDDMRLAVNKALKLQMENFGEAWQGVEHARKFLGVPE